MFRSLYSRLALTLFALLLVVGLLLVQLVRYTSDLYQQEVAQKLNADLAYHMVKEQPLLRDSQVNRESLEHLFHLLMVINPSIELYLLDPDGRILAYSAPEGKVKRQRVDLAPVQEFLDGQARYPLTGDDPRGPERHKVFSAAPVKSDGKLEGYLYIVLGGEQYDNTVAMLRNSFILSSSAGVLMLALFAALILGLAVFFWQTRRLRGLSALMARYAHENGEQRPGVRFQSAPKEGDEIDGLGRCFNEMAGTIDRQMADLERLDAMRRDLVANVSHDLRTPLTTMQGYMETLLLKERDLSEDERRHYVQTALQHSRRLGELVSELFELARLDSTEAVVYAEPFSMNELVQDVCQKFHLRATQKSIELRPELDTGAQTLVYGDIGMLQRVLENLLANALRHTPEGGRVTLAVKPATGLVQVRVSDTGSGIPDANVERIFDRFYKLDRQRRGDTGAGLGLAIVRRILELHGSEINVSSRVDQGTTFTFHLEAAGAA